MKIPKIQCAGCLKIMHYRPSRVSVIYKGIIYYYHVPCYGKNFDISILQETTK